MLLKSRAKQLDVLCRIRNTPKFMVEVAGGRHVKEDQHVFFDWAPCSANRPRLTLFPFKSNQINRATKSLEHLSIHEIGTNQAPLDFSNSNQFIKYTEIIPLVTDSTSNN